MTMDEYIYIYIYICMHKNYISYYSLFWEKYYLWDIRVIGHFLTKSRDFETSITATLIIHCNTRGSTITTLAIKITSKLFIITDE